MPLQIPLPGLTTIHGFRCGPDYKTFLKKTKHPWGLTGSAAAATRGCWRFFPLRLGWADWLLPESLGRGWVDAAASCRAVPMLTTTTCFRTLGVMPTPASRRRQRYAILHITVTSPHSLS